MPFYNYNAMNLLGKKIRGTMAAANESDLEQRLKEIKLDLISVKEAKQTKLLVRSNVTIKDLILLCVHLEQLDKAGVPLLDSIGDLRDSADNQTLKNLMGGVYEDVKGGALLSQAMGRYPAVFNEVFIGLVAAGEKTGNLAEIFAHLANHLRWVHEIRNKVKKAIYYPAFLLVLMLGVISLMMLFVVPKLSGFLKAQNFELPLYTRALIGMSDLFSQYWYMLFIIPFVFVALAKLMISQSGAAAYNFDKFKLSIPILGTVIRKIELARFCHFFGVTFQSGIGILECLEISQSIIKNKVIRDEITAARLAVSEGSTLTNALKVSGQFPSLVIRMFKVGEESGNLQSALSNITFFYDREVDTSVNNMVGVLQPALTLILGGIMLWVSVAVFGPLYGSFSKMQF